MFESDELFDCFLNLPVPPTQENPLDLQWLKQHQDDDPVFQQVIQALPDSYFVKSFGDHDLVCHVNSDSDPETQWKICLTEKTLIPTIYWFLEVLNHPGRERLFQAISQRYYHPVLRHWINSWNCDTCQRYKIDGAGYSLLEP